MIDVKTQVVAQLETILPTYYEYIVQPTTPLPCITYYESSNVSDIEGNTLGYSNIGFTIKLWTRNVSDIATYVGQIDKVMRDLGFKRIASNEIVEDNLILKVSTYKALALEKFN